MRHALFFAGGAQTNSWIERAMASHHVTRETLVRCQNCLPFRRAKPNLRIHWRRVKGKKHVRDSFFHKPFEPTVPGWREEPAERRQPGRPAPPQPPNRSEIESRETQD